MQSCRFLADAVEALAQRQRTPFSLQTPQPKRRAGRPAKKDKKTGEQKASFKRIKKSPKLKRLFSKTKLAGRSSNEVSASSSSSPLTQQAPGLRTLAVLAPLHSALLRLGIPREALPTDVPKGKKSYTVHHPSDPSKGSIQVLHAKASYYLNLGSDGHEPDVRTISWHLNNGPAGAWEIAKEKVKW
jgi:hypothetical protein